MSAWPILGLATAAGLYYYYRGRKQPQSEAKVVPQDDKRDGGQNHDRKTNSSLLLPGARASSSRSAQPGFRPAAIPSSAPVQTMSQSYIAELMRTFPSSPPFYHGRLADAIADAKGAGKLLCIIIHNPAPDSAFEREILCTDHVSDVLRENYITYFLLARTKEAYQLEHLLRVASPYPFVGVLYPQGPTELALLQKLQGPTTVETLMTVLISSLELKDNHVERLAQEQSRREGAIRLERELVSQQDREYDEALMLDQLEQKQLEESRAREEAKRLEEEAAERARLSEEKAKEELKHRQQARRVALHDSLGSEPAPSTGVEVCVRLPGGVRAVRRFAVDATLADVVRFVDSHELSLPDGRPLIPPSVLNLDAGLTTTYPLASYPYLLVSTLPRRVFQNENMPLKDLNMGSKVLLILETR